MSHCELFSLGDLLLGEVCLQEKEYKFTWRAPKGSLGTVQT